MSPDLARSSRRPARQNVSFGPFSKERSRQQALDERRAAISFGQFSTEPRHSPVFRSRRFSAKTGALPAFFALVFLLAFFDFAHRHPLHSAALGAALLVAGCTALAFRFWPRRGHGAKVGMVAALSSLAVALSVCALADVASPDACRAGHCAHGVAAAAKTMPASDASVAAPALH